MSTFVSYCRADNSLSRLLELEIKLSPLGSMYIDDLHHRKDVDRIAEVHAAFAGANSFLAILTTNYLRTPWTRYEAESARARRMPLLILTETEELRECGYSELLLRVSSTA